MPVHIKIPITQTILSASKNSISEAILYPNQLKMWDSAGIRNEYGLGID
jgi:hypothetical protein